MSDRSLRITLDSAELNKQLDQLAKIGTKTQRKAILRKGARVAAKYLKANTPKKTKNLFRSVGDKTWSRSRDYFATFLIKKAKRDPYYAAFQNEGYTHTSGKYVSEHKGFMQSAIRQATSDVQNKLKEELNKFIKKNSRV